MTNEQIVSEIRNGYSVTDYMQLLYESNLPLIKKFIKPYDAYEPMEDLLQESSKSQLWSIVERYTTDRENSIIKEIFINNRTMAAVAREQGVTRFLFGTNQGHLHFTDIF